MLFLTHTDFLTHTKILEAPRTHVTHTTNAEVSTHVIFFIHAKVLWIYATHAIYQTPVTKLWFKINFGNDNIVEVCLCIAFSAKKIFQIKSYTFELPFIWIPWFLELCSCPYDWEDFQFLNS